MKKAIYKPTNQKIIILSQIDNYCEIFIDGEEKNVPLSDIIFDKPKSDIKLSSIEELKISLIVVPSIFNIIAYFFKLFYNIHT